MELNNIKPSEIVFNGKLFASDFSVIFLVMVHDQILRALLSSDTDGNSITVEGYDGTTNRKISAAYRRLRGSRVVWTWNYPSFPWDDGEVRSETNAKPYHLKMFLHDKYLPSAIFLEYIPNLEMIQLHNYTQKRMDNFLRGIQEIHGAGVRHRDPKHRNMMVVNGDSERVVWIDFDRAETYNLPVTDEQKRLLDEEEEIVRGFWDCLVKCSAPIAARLRGFATHSKSHYLLQQADCTKGKPDEAYFFYCT
ncbi:hypothetical protein ACO22_05765 [Paracoccidioides brasiliensis]|uniref:Protein kinase domain-containing protein n=1 Tax=Paracoccidioides brasiliensis TaxID=121759 RepID=A0A1D2J9K8_PARBR|nr:hypothetical protein ACO22_05765 [Paracoccidioides brasiliensis]